jgi:MYXO-CTERM domain-containing protein
MRMATEAWRGLPGSPDLVFGSTADLSEPDATDGINGVYISDAPLDGDHLAETRLTFEPNTGRIIDVDVVVSGLDPWEVMSESGSQADVYDLGAVLTHEMGHALGLADEPAVDQATMFPRFRFGDTRARTPEVDDERGVLAAYREHPAQGAMSTGCSAGGQGSAGGALGLALIALAVSRRQQRRRVYAHG